MKRLGYGPWHPSAYFGRCSVDDVFVIVMFTAFTGLASGGTGLTAGGGTGHPCSILTGVAAGLLLGWLLGGSSPLSLSHGWMG